MSEIPKRPVWERRPHLELLTEFRERVVAHEHAVAKVAVEALNTIHQIGDKNPGFGHSCAKEAAQALAVIDASGWTP